MTAPPAPYETRRSGSGRTVVIALAIMGGVILVGMLTCVGAFTGLALWGTGLVASQVQAAVEEPLAAHVGAIESFEMNWIESGRIEEPDVMVYDVEGSAGSGRLVADHVSEGADHEKVRWAVLHPAGGEAALVIVGEPPAKFLER